MPGARTGGQRVQRGVVAAGEHRAAGRPPAREEVDPGDRVAVAVVGGGQPGHQVVQVAGPLGVDRHQCRFDRLEPQRRGEDHAGQPHAPRRRVEQGRARGDGADPAVGGEQLQREHVPREGPRHVVVLAVDVRADRPADRHIAGAGRHRHEPAERQQHLHQPVQGDARVAQHGAARDVDGVHAVQGRHVEHGAPGVLRRVPVRPAEPPGDAAPGPAVPDGDGRLLVRPRPDEERRGGRRAAPAGDGAPVGVGNGVGRHGGDRIAPSRHV